MSQRSVDLTGLWRFQPDPGGEGVARRWFDPQVDVRHWREVAVPCTVDDCMRELAGYEGRSWFRREIELDAPSPNDAEAILRFEGVNYNARVWLNGLVVGAHEGGFLRFELPATRALRSGRNVLAVEVDNTRRHGEVPGKQRGWRPFGGIIREASLDLRPPRRIADCRVTARADGYIAIDATIINHADSALNAVCRLVVTTSDGDVVTLAPDPSAAVTVPSRATAPLHIQTRGAGVRPWSPEHPTLYVARLTLEHGDVSDACDVTFGFRTIETRGHELLLNGEPIRLRGFNRHEDTFERGPLPDQRGAERDLRHMKQLGANFVRLCHYPHHPSTLDLCDRLGLLAMGEIPLYWWNGDADGDIPASRKFEAARRQLREMIDRDINHPSVVFWSVSNETLEDRSEVAAGNAALVEEARRLDPSRLAVHVSDHWRDAPRFECDDVICVNAYPSFRGRHGPDGYDYDFAESAGWWREQLARLHARRPDKPILIAEFGYTAWRGVFDSLVSEDAQEAAIVAEASAFDSPYICGHAIWCYADHPWPEEPFLNHATTSPYGLVTRDRRPKRVCRRLREVFGAPALPAPPPADLSAAPVRMIRRHMKDLPDAPMPNGYTMRAMQPHEAGLWEDVQRDAEPYIRIEPGLFHDQFGDDPQAVSRRCFFIVGSDGCAAGTISAWYGRRIEEGDWGRIHWVAVRRAHQRRGLALAAMSHAMKFLAAHHDRAWLDTSTARLGAIRLYLDYGFEPDLDPPGAAEAWQAVAAKLDHAALRNARQ